MDSYRNKVRKDNFNKEYFSFQLEFNKNYDDLGNQLEKNKNQIDGNMVKDL